MSTLIRSRRTKKSKRQPRDSKAKSASPVWNATVPRPELYPLGGQRQSETATLRWCNVLSINPAATLTSASFLSFRLNSSYDIDSSGGQPTGYGKLIARYHTSICQHAKAMFQWMPNSSASAIGSMAALFIHDGQTDVSGAATLPDLLEMKGRVGDWRPLGALADVTQSTLRAAVDIGKYYRTNPLNDSENYGSGVSAGPIETIWLTIAIVNPDAAQTTDPGAINFLVTIDQKVCLIGPKAVTGNAAMPPLTTPVLALNLDAPRGPYVAGPWSYAYDSKHGPRRTHVRGMTEMLSMVEYNAHAKIQGFPLLLASSSDDSMKPDSTPRGWVLP